MQLTEDDIYRSSSQFRNWSFTPAQLASKRQTTNIQARERVKAAVARHRAQRLLQPDVASASESERGNGSGIENGSNTPIPPSSKEVDCLTMAEEMKLVDSFCERTLQLGTFLKFPIEVTATAIQYLRRFYLVNSPMTYEPQTISRSTMYLATKVECHHRPAADYAASLSKTTPETVIAPEYLIVQGLRFTFDVKHPFRGLKGGHLELIEMARGNAAPISGSTKNPTEIREVMLQLPRTANTPSSKTMTPSDLEKRINQTYTLASDLLKTIALLTDAYFLYTPSQIWLSAHLLIDEPLTLFYVSTKVPPSSPIHAKLISTLRACAGLLSSHRKYTSSNTSEEEKKEREDRDKKEVSSLMKKLKQCRDPDKIDLVKLNQAKKRDAVKAGGELDENKAKRRKLGREGMEKESESFWGPELVVKGNGIGGGDGS